MRWISESRRKQPLTSLIGREVQHKQLKRFIKDFIFRYFLAHTGLSRAANKLFTAFQKSLYWFCKLLTAERIRSINEQTSMWLQEEQQWHLQLHRQETRRPLNVRVCVCVCVCAADSCQRVTAQTHCCRVLQHVFSGCVNWLLLVVIAASCNLLLDKNTVINEDKVFSVPRHLGDDVRELISYHVDNWK